MRSADTKEARFTESSDTKNPAAAKHDRAVEAWDLAMRDLANQRPDGSLARSRTERLRIEGLPLMRRPAASPELLEAAKSLAAIVFRQCGGYSGGPGRDALDAAQALRAAIAAEEARKPTAPARLIERAAACSDGNSSHKTLQAIVDDVAKAEPAADPKPGEPDGWIASFLHAEVRKERDEAVAEKEKWRKLSDGYCSREAEAVARAEKAEGQRQADLIDHSRREADLLSRAEKAEASADDKLRKLQEWARFEHEKMHREPAKDAAQEGRMFAMADVTDMARNLLAEPVAEAKDAPEPESDDGPLLAMVQEDIYDCDVEHRAVRELCRRALEGGGR